MAIEKIKILGAVLELSAKQHYQSSPFNRQCCLAMDTDKLSYVKSIATYAPHIFWVYYFSLSHSANDPI